MEEIYFDNSATTPVAPEVAEVMLEACTDYYGNPSSLHAKGIEAEKEVKWARETVSGMLNCRASEVFFTSGGTEANNWAIHGAARQMRRGGNRVVTTSIEHPSILEECKRLETEGFEVTYLPVDSSGFVRLETLEETLDPKVGLVSVMHVNNEVGSIQPVAEIGQIVKRKSPHALFHVDAVQSFGRLQTNPKASGIDLMTVSAHKIYGPKGIGALFIRSGVSIPPLLVGGDQEGGIRAGTENVPGIAGFGAAARFMAKKDDSNDRMLRERLVAGLNQEIDAVRINSPEAGGIPNIVNFSLPGLKGEVLVHYLEQSGIFISTGSACHSRRKSMSHVLEAMGLDRSVRGGAVRVSFGWYNTKIQVDLLVERLKTAANDLRRLGEV